MFQICHQQPPNSTNQFNKKITHWAFYLTKIWELGNKTNISYQMLAPNTLPCSKRQMLRHLKQGYS